MERNNHFGGTKGKIFTNANINITGLDMTVSELLDFPEMNETLFEDE